MFCIMYVPGASTPEFFQLRLGFVTSTSCGRLQVGNRPCSHGAVSHVAQGNVARAPRHSEAATPSV